MPTIYKDLTIEQKLHRKNYLSNWRKTKGKDKQEGYYRDQRLTNQSLKKKCVIFLGGKCCKCGYNKNLAALDFHHKDMSTKEEGLSNLINRRLAKTLDECMPELVKCICVCSNCHRELHFNDSMYLMEILFVNETIEEASEIIKGDKNDIR